MKAFYIPCLALICLAAPVSADPPKAAPTPVDVLKMAAIPDGKFSVSLQLKQLDGVPAKVTLESRGGGLQGTDARFGKMQGSVQPIGNGVFMVQLRGTGYVATQFWVFRPDGSAAIKEIPDRGEQQTAVPQ
jgi:hypothetical protein